MEIDRFRLYMFFAEGLCAMGALLSAVAGRWDVAAAGWGVACYCAIQRQEKRE